MLWKEDLVDKNKYSRPAKKLTEVKGIVVHWTANPGGSDTAHQKFFDGADGGGSRYAGAHLFVDSDSATLIIPLNEIAYHANEKECKIDKLGDNANLTTIGVEMCVEKDGTIHPNTVKRTVEVVAELCKKFKLNPINDVYRHYDVTGKNCPRPWVESPARFKTFKDDVKQVIEPKTYTVYRDDTLWEIARKLDTSVDMLKKKNGLKTNVIHVGQKLKF